MIDLTNGLPELGQAKEGFRRGSKHTKDYHMWLVERVAPTPSEKEILESVPFMQGAYDFSMILGERIYDNRTITFKFEIKNRDYTNRKIVQTSLENWLMKDGFSPLYDDHAEYYYYIAKCVSITTEDVLGGLRLDIQFDAYPFKISEYEEGNDIWDIFNFELDAAQQNKYTINGSRTVNFINVGESGKSPKIIASDSMVIIKNGITYNIPAGKSESESFRLEIGENPMTITGQGAIEFLLYKELL